MALSSPPSVRTTTSTRWSFPALLLVLAACFGCAGAFGPGGSENHRVLDSGWPHSQPITESHTAGNSEFNNSKLSDWPVSAEILSPLSSESKQTVTEIEAANSPSLNKTYNCTLCSRTFK